MRVFSKEAAIWCVCKIVNIIKRKKLNSNITVLRKKIIRAKKILHFFLYTYISSYTYSITVAVAHEDIQSSYCILIQTVYNYAMARDFTESKYSKTMSRIITHHGTLYNFDGFNFRSIELNNISLYSATHVLIVREILIALELKKRNINQSTHRNVKIRSYYVIVVIFSVSDTYFE